MCLLRVVAALYYPFQNQITTECHHYRSHSERQILHLRYHRRHAISLGYSYQHRLCYYRAKEEVGQTEEGNLADAELRSRRSIQ